MNNTHSQLSNSATTSHQVTQLMNTDILILNLTSDVAEFLIVDDEC